MTDIYDEMYHLRNQRDAALRHVKKVEEEKVRVLDEIEKLQGALARLVLALHGTEVISSRRHGKSTLKESLEYAASVLEGEEVED